jgi:hypothetical protein
VFSGGCFLLLAGLLAACGEPEPASLHRYSAVDVLVQQMIDNSADADLRQRSNERTAIFPVGRQCQDFHPCWKGQAPLESHDVKARDNEEADACDCDEQNPKLLVRHLPLLDRAPLHTLGEQFRVVARQEYGCDEAELHPGANQRLSRLLDEYTGVFRTQSLELSLFKPEKSFGSVYERLKQLAPPALLPRQPLPSDSNADLFAACWSVRQNYSPGPIRLLRKALSASSLSSCGVGWTWIFWSVHSV